MILQGSLHQFLTYMEKCLPEHAVNHHHGIIPFGLGLLLSISVDNSRSLCNVGGRSLFLELSHRDEWQ